MCIVIDACCFAHVFNTSSKKHDQFRPVLKWVVDGNGKLVYGGTKYKEHLLGAKKYLRIFLELGRGGKVVVLNDIDVDRIEQQLKQDISNPDFDDHHIIAIIIVSRCMLVCSDDKRSYRIIKQRCYYPNPVKPPRIYSKKSNKTLLTDKYIADICKPCSRGARDLYYLLDN